jgi:hypothetical protein
MHVVPGSEVRIMFLETLLNDLFNNLDLDSWMNAW